MRLMCSCPFVLRYRQTPLLGTGKTNRLFHGTNLTPEGMLIYNSIHNKRKQYAPPS